MKEFNNWVLQNYPQAKPTGSGLYYIVEKEGDGPKAANGQQVQVNYTGRFIDGKVFDSSIEEVAREAGMFNPNRTYGPLKFVLGKGQVIKGWDEGIALMKVGGKIKLIIPYQLAYGEAGRSSIPPKSTLIFDSELVAIE